MKDSFNAKNNQMPHLQGFWSLNVYSYVHMQQERQSVFI